MSVEATSFIDIYFALLFCPAERTLDKLTLLLTKVSRSMQH